MPVQVAWLDRQEGGISDTDIRVSFGQFDVLYTDVDLTQVGGICYAVHTVLAAEFSSDRQEDRAALCGTYVNDPDCPEYVEELLLDGSDGSSLIEMTGVMEDALGAWGYDIDESSSPAQIHVVLDNPFSDPYVTSEIDPETGDLVYGLSYAGEYGDGTQFTNVNAVVEDINTHY